MPVEVESQPETEQVPLLKLEGINDSSPEFSDVFMVARDGDSGLVSMYFFRRQLDLPNSTEPTPTMRITKTRAKCVGHIIFPINSVEKVLEGLFQQLPLEAIPALRAMLDQREASA